MKGLIFKLAFAIFLSTIILTQAIANDSYKKGLTLGAQGKFEQSQKILLEDKHLAKVKICLTIIEDIAKKRLKSELGIILFKGLFLENLDKIFDALAEYNKVIATNNNYDLAYYIRANANKKAKKPALAISDYDKAIELNPKNGGAYFKRGAIKLYTYFNIKGGCADIIKAGELGYSSVWCNKKPNRIPTSSSLITY